MNRQTWGWCERNNNIKSVFVLYNFRYKVGSIWVSDYCPIHYYEYEDTCPVDAYTSCKECWSKYYPAKRQKCWPDFYKTGKYGWQYFDVRGWENPQGAKK